MVELQPSKLATWVRSPSPAKHNYMQNIVKKFFLLGFILIFIFAIPGCSESPEKKKARENKINELILSGNTYFTNQDYKSSYLDFKQAVKLNKKDDGELYYKLAYSAIKGESRTNEALKYYDMAIKYLKGLDSLWYLSGSYFNSAVIYKTKRNIKKQDDYFASAFDLLNKMYDLEIRDGITLFRLAYCYMEKNDTSRAIELYTNSAKLLKITNPKHPYYAGAYFNVGKIYLEQENLDDALKMWKIAVSIETQNAYFKSWISKVEDLKLERQ